MKSSKQCIWQGGLNLAEKPKIKLSELADIYDIENDEVQKIEATVKAVVNADVEFEDFTDVADEEEVKDG